MTYTMTEESKFETSASGNDLVEAVDGCRNRLESSAKLSGYPFLVPSSWLMTVKRRHDGRFLVTAEAVYAKIIMAPTEKPSEEEDNPFS